MFELVADATTETTILADLSEDAIAGQTIARIEYRDRRDEHRLGRRDDHSRRKQRNGLHNTETNRRITLATANTDDLWTAIKELRLRQNTERCDSPSDGSEYDYSVNTSRIMYLKILKRARK